MITKKGKLMENYKLGKAEKQWNDNAQDITFIVTEDCNLRCKYCYISHKASNAKMSFEVAKKFIDYIFTMKIKNKKAVILDFIGGEPLIEVELVDQICDYFKIKAYEVNSDWYWNYRINMATNGINYSDDKVQQFILKNKGKISIGISVDGTKEKHDAQRVFPDGSGSYEIIEKNFPLWISQFGGRTKATFSHDDLKYLKDSMISLWNKGITNVSANVVFEDVWEDDDDILLEKQLTELADYALENNLFDKYLCSFFDDNIGGFYDQETLNSSWCGAGKMLTVGPNGNIYPCLRYKDYSLNKNPEWTIGNVDDGIDMEKVRPFVMTTTRLQSDSECIDCGAATGCAFCQGFCYDEAEIPTNFIRAKYICKMHKARVRANDYYFSKLYNIYGIEKEGKKHEYKRLNFLLSDDYITYCQYENTNASVNYMQGSTIRDGLIYARNNFFNPIFVHSKSEFSFKNVNDYNAFRIHHIVPAKFYKEAANLKDYILVFEKDDLNLDVNELTECQLNVNSHDIANLFIYTKELLKKAKRVNINIINLDRHFENEYHNQLTAIVNHLAELNSLKNNHYEINLLDDLITEVQKKYPEHKNCKAGDRSFGLAPDGKFYVCSAYYSTKPDQDIGNIQEGFTKFKGQHLYKSEYQPICKTCDVYSCLNCVYLNESETREVNISPSYQCRKGLIEKEAGGVYMKLMYGTSKILPVEYHDPIEQIISDNESFVGFYSNI